MLQVIQNVFPLICFLIVTTTWVSAIFSQAVTPKTSLTEIEQYLDDLAAKGFSGSVLLVKDDRVLLRKGYGLANRNDHQKITPETGFDIGSITKVFTSAAIFKLEHEGKLSLDDKITKYFKNVPPDKAEISVRQLITHTSGLPDLVKAEGNSTTYSADDYDYDPVSRDEIINRAMLSHLIFKPGASSKYSNTGYSLLGAIIEMVSGKPYEKYVHDALFVPAGMKKTGYEIPKWNKKDLATGYRNDRAWGTPLDHAWLKDGPSWNLRANGGMLSTVDDLYLWVKALRDDKALPKAVKERYLTAMGVTANKRGVRIMGPAGSNDIFNAAYVWVLEEDRVLVVFSNVDKYPAEEYIGKLAGMMLRSGN
jgi:CubicO group peptidase (beta-lactamase class C family)